MDRLGIAIIVGVVAGAVLGVFVARASAKHEPVYGSGLARALHYLAAAAFTGGIPAGLTELITGGGLGFAVLVAFLFIGTSFLALFAFAAVEKAPRDAALAAKMDRGWTEADARASGM